ncbi:MAG: hypothetical protein PHS02_01785 [Candidatus ainarchaeum sp.]|nr:hypothetical protein [Candidatus ainarchaeum sp.]
MNSNFGGGTNNAMEGVVYGAVSAAFVDILANAGVIPAEWMLFFNLVNGLATIGFLMKIPSWGATYLLGWLFGMYIMLQSGLMGIVDVIAYFVIPLLYVGYKIYCFITGN